MSISKLVSIAWNGTHPDPTAHDTGTDVIVLTGNQYFVDLRIQKSSGKVDWAFAGTRKSEPGFQEGETRCTWDHLISSRVSLEDHRKLHPGPVASDSGINSPHPADPINLTLEQGEMLNPATGRVEPYEEIWKDDPPPEPGTHIAFVEREDGEAIIGILGNKHLCIGIGWVWYSDNGEILSWSWDEGQQGREHEQQRQQEQHNSIKIIQAIEGAVEGDRIDIGDGGKWVVRESWCVGDVDSVR